MAASDEEKSRCSLVICNGFGERKRKAKYAKAFMPFAKILFRGAPSYARTLLDLALNFASLLRRDKAVYYM